MSNYKYIKTKYDYNMLVLTQKKKKKISFTYSKVGSWDTRPYF